jgi:hypothetical protein
MTLALFPVRLLICWTAWKQGTPRLMDELKLVVKGLLRLLGMMS